MLRALTLAIRQLPDPRFTRVVIRSLILSALTFAVLLGAAWWLLSGMEITGWGWLDRIIEGLGGVAAIWLAALLYPGAVMLIASFLLDDVAAAVEDKHYPHLPPPRQQPWWEIALTGIRFTVIAIIVNLIVLPIYLTGLIAPSFLAFFLPLLGIVSLLNIFVFYGLNGYLLGREYFELVAHRRLDPRAARTMRRRHWVRVQIAGIAAAVILSIPLVNLVGPVIAAAMMVHQFEFMRGRGSGANSPRGGRGAEEE